MLLGGELDWELLRHLNRELGCKWERERRISKIEHCISWCITEITTSRGSLYSWIILILTNKYFTNLDWLSCLALNESRQEQTEKCRPWLLPSHPGKAVHGARCREIFGSWQCAYVENRKHHFSAWLMLYNVVLSIQFVLGLSNKSMIWLLYTSRTKLLWTHNNDNNDNSHFKFNTRLVSYLHGGT